MLYPLFLLASALISLYEARISAQHSAELVQRGAVEIAPKIFPMMAALYLLMYFGSFAEYLWTRRSVSIIWFACGLLLFAVSKLLKFWSASSLGERWTMKVLILPGSEVVTSGPYRYIKHPNYVAVLLEIITIPLLGKSFLTFAIVFALFSVVLFYRIQSEERALMQYTNYSQGMLSKRRFVP
jgi:methyltransferase